MDSRDQSSEASSSKEVQWPLPGLFDISAVPQEFRHLFESDNPDAGATSSSLAHPSDNTASASTHHHILSRGALDVPHHQSYDNSSGSHFYGRAVPSVFAETLVCAMPGTSHTAMADHSPRDDAQAAGFGYVFDDQVNQPYPGAGAWQSPFVNDPLPSVIDPRLIFCPPSTSTEIVPPPAPSAPSATLEDEKENQPTPGSSARASQSIPPTPGSPRATPR
ncbi:hypothetical protein BV20DRAFT_975987 [Pilatotrama ljubarskyi]|nr:hypothetical protein BV20DRAFT_975987 [Pilatotrama ljubarskyi]